jgi:formylglycine-generating enzyme required for sulfatase activity
MPGAATSDCDSTIAAVTTVGAYTGSASPYGIFDQGGNVWEWNEEIVSGSYRGIRGGSWVIYAGYLAASFPFGNDPTNEDDSVGFRVASLVPEPGPGWLGMTAVLSLAAWRKRTAKAL